MHLSVPLRACRGGVSQQHWESLTAAHLVRSKIHSAIIVFAVAGHNILRPTVQHLCVHTMQRRSVSTSCRLELWLQCPASLPAAGQQTVHVHQVWKATLVANMQQ
jgi:hypothetical protein